MNALTRRTFLSASLAATLVRPRLRAAAASESDLRVAIVGLNKQGRNHLRGLLRSGEARLVALCDVDENVLARGVKTCAEAGLQVAPFRDFRQLLERRDIDAVILATPNHWHSLQTIWGVQAGKHVYVEKPLSHNVWEGAQAVAAARQHPRIVVQAGTQSRSSRDIVAAIAWLRAGHIGRIRWVRCLCYNERPGIGKTRGPQPVPAGIDYDLWTGPAELVPPHRDTPENGPVHYDWHWIWNYGGGDLANQGIHQMDVARWILGESGFPRSVVSVAGRFGYEDDGETPNTQVAVFDYPSAPLLFEMRGLPAKAGMKAMDSYRGTRVAVVVDAEGGYLIVSMSGEVMAFDQAHRKMRAFTEGGAAEHRANFFAAIRAGRPDAVTASPQDCHVSSALCHLANISHRVGLEAGAGRIGVDALGDLGAEAYERMLLHLEANGVSRQSVRPVLGARLKPAPDGSRFVDGEADLRARADALLIREGRAAFRVPRLT